MTSIEEPSWLEIGDREKHSPLHVAVAAAACESARLLMEAGADPNARGRAGETPLHLANCSKHVRTLLRHGADPHLTASYNPFQGKGRRGPDSPKSRILSKIKGKFSLCRYLASLQIW